MKKKQEKSEKQLEAARLTNQVVKLEMTKVPIHWQRELLDGTMQDEVHNCELCIVNGVKYIRKKSFEWDGGDFISNMENNGTIKSDDILHFYNLSKDRYQKGHMHVLVKTDVMLKLKDEMMDYLKQSHCSSLSIEFANCAYKAINNTSVVIDEYTIDEEKLKESEAAYDRRIKLIKENKEDKQEKEWREESERYEAECKERELERLSQGEMLQELVAKIEAMGWEVTLRMKTQVSIEPANDNVDFNHL